MTTITHRRRRISRTLLDHRRVARRKVVVLRGRLHRTWNRWRALALQYRPALVTPYVIQLVKILVAGGLSVLVLQVLDSHIGSESDYLGLMLLYIISLTVPEPRTSLPKKAAVPKGLIKDVSQLALRLLLGATALCTLYQCLLNLLPFTPYFPQFLFNPVFSLISSTSFASKCFLWRALDENGWLSEANSALKIFQKLLFLYLCVKLLFNNSG